MADIAPQSLFQAVPDGIEMVVGDLRSPDFCSRVVHGASIVLHFAANMGGMGTIHEENEIQIYRDNHMMLLNVLQACMDPGSRVEKFLFASSACVYPDSLQRSSEGDIPLREVDVWNNPNPPHPQGLYGLEKLVSEVVLLRGALGSLKTYVARFHNIYGPYGSWRGGREKVPAALLRKAVVAQESGNYEMEIWGSGTQKRSFCYIDDAVEGVLKLLDSECHDPVNIGSEEIVTIDELAFMAAEAVGMDSRQLQLKHIEGRPVGVASRNSDNTFVRERLGWEPKVGLRGGLQETGRWIKEEIHSLRGRAGETASQGIFNEFKKSTLVHLKPGKIVFALLLPVTSRASATTDTALPAHACLGALRTFAQSVLQTTRDDTKGEHPQFSFRVYLAIDHDDEVLWDGDSSRAEHELRDAGIGDVVTLKCNFPRGHVCSLWRRCARAAWEGGCDYFVLLGDDVTLHTPGWMSTIHSAFVSISEDVGVPFGLGCVAFKDTSFAGMPTFPVVHRTHMSIFNGQVVPDVFVNQDGDPFLYQLYRRFGCSRESGCEIRNSVGGSNDARYEKQHAKDWTFGTLTEAACVVEAWLARDSSYHGACRRLTIDVVIPCYRVMMDYIDKFLALEVPPTCSVMFIIIIDNPNSPHIDTLQERYGRRFDVRIRVNKQNSGASASRNRGLSESAAEWVLFLDDDVAPESDILLQLEKSIRDSPSAAGFVGNAQFPHATTTFTTALHLAGVTYFWDIATKIPESIRHDVPWGVTANIAARRDANDGVLYDLDFPKTGGGEDIDYCRKKREYVKARGGLGFVAAPKVTVTHPYWNNGRRSYWRFYGWSKGDGALVKRYPDLVYVDVPNSAELLLLSIIVSLLTLAAMFTSNVPPPLQTAGPKLFASVFVANVIHDCYRHLWRDADRTHTIKTDIAGSLWFAAVVESSLIRMFSEWGRVIGLLERREFHLFCRRFDWFAGAYGNAPKNEEIFNNGQRIVLSVALLAVIMAY